MLHQRLQTEEDKGLQMAYASALGNLHATAAVPDLLQLLYTTNNPKARLELTLALARLVGDEHPFIQLVRTTRNDLGTGIAQALTAIKKKVDRAARQGGETPLPLDECITAFARNQLTEGITTLVTILTALPEERFAATSRQILVECAQRLAEFTETHAEESHVEYLLLTLYVLDVGWQ
jgi:hypothetical protein